MTPAFADPDAPSRPLHVVAADALPGWLDRQPQEAAVWLQDGGFRASLGEVRLIPGPGGTVGGAVIGFGTAKTRARSRFALSRAVAALPAGDWHFEGLAPEHRAEAALGWLLAQYRFDRYRPAPAILPGLKCPDGVNEAQIR
ncbi:MAG: leucyl aminopeptidase family protein, partial [Gemmobacter sp.]